MRGLAARSPAELHSQGWGWGQPAAQYGTTLDMALLSISGKMKLGRQRQVASLVPSSPGSPTTYLHSVPQVLPKHECLLGSLLFLLTVLLLGSTARLISLGLLIKTSKQDS